MEVRGSKELMRQLKRAGQLEGVKQVVKADGARLQRRAQRYVPVDTGTLKRSIGLELSADGLTVIAEPHTEYAAYVEYGTRYMAAQPYMRPAFEETAEEFKAHLRRLMR